MIMKVTVCNTISSQSCNFDQIYVMFQYLQIVSKAVVINLKEGSSQDMLKRGEISEAPKCRTMSHNRPDVSQ